MRRRPYYIVDAYNVIYACPSLLAKSHDLEEARAKLLHVLIEYAAYERLELTVVFDGAVNRDWTMHAQGKGETEKLAAHVRVIYTDEGETADSRIERLAYEAARENREVHVVTSDSAEQFVALGAGAYRLPSMELYRRVQKARRGLEKEYLKNPTPEQGRNEVASHLDEATRKKLDALRKSRV